MTEDTPEAWEQVRRSIAMLAPGAWALRREQALQALSSLIVTLRAQQAAADDNDSRA
ncbi:MAG: hypothetical protein R2706_05140 [Acidimicrobiales bacterium]